MFFSIWVQSFCSQIVDIMPVYYRAYCPAAEGTPCRKGTASMGSFNTEAEARKAVFNHLTGSIYHEMPEDEANDLARNAELEEVQYKETPDPRSATKPKAASTAAAPIARSIKSGAPIGAPIGASSSSTPLRLSERHRSRSRSRSRSRDTQPPVPPASTRHRITAGRLDEIVREGVRNAILDAQATENMGNDARLVNLGHDSAEASWMVAISALTKVEAASRTTARFARQAAEAFEDQAHIISQQILVLQRLGFMRREN